MWMSTFFYGILLESHMATMNSLCQLVIAFSQLLIWRILSHGVYHRVVLRKPSPSAEKETTSVLRFEELTKKGTRRALLTGFLIPWRWRWTILPLASVLLLPLHAFIYQKIEVIKINDKQTKIGTRYLLSTYISLCLPLTSGYLHLHLPLPLGLPSRIITHW
jgi:hypothetical protein